MMKKLTWLVVGITLLVAHTALAGPRGRDGFRRGGDRNLSVEERVNRQLGRMTACYSLTQEQQEKVEAALRKKWQEKTKVGRGSPEAMASIRQEFRDSVHSVLTQDQRTKFDKDKPRRQRNKGNYPYRGKGK